MGLHLIGVTWDVDTLLAFWDSTLAILEVAVGLGLVIFVHELGHFSVAKLCGVKCEKFYLGFDIAGLRLWRHRWGETEYGIGILPLGGYVKMLGQEDNPARLKEEIERAKLSAAPDAADKNVAAQDIAGKTDTVKAEEALYDPRSFLAQSVPKRLAIISAGVIMNLIFAFLMATLAYRLGVRQIAAGVGQINPGEAAWQSNFHVGDRILEIGDRKIRRFRDLQEAVSLGNIKQGIPFVVQRSGQSMPITIVVTPDASGLVPRIGIRNPLSTTLLKAGLPAMPGSAAAEAKPPFELGDRIIKIDGRPIREYEQIESYLAEHPEKTLQVTVERKPAPSAEQDIPPNENAPPKEVVIELPPQPVRGLGLEMTIGEICAIQKDSPAEAVKLRPGDRIQAIDHQPVGDPLTLPERLRARTGKMIVLTVVSKGAVEPHDVPVRLRPSNNFALGIDLDYGSPVGIPQLGIAYHVSVRVNAVQPGSPAAEAGLQSGDQLTAVRFIPPSAETLRKFKPREVTIDFDADHYDWPTLLNNLLQQSIPGTTVELRWTRQGEAQKAVLTPVTDKGSFCLERGLLFEPIYFFQVAKNWSGAAADGAEETWNSTLLVYRTLSMLGTQISPRALGGPVMIFRAAKGAASEGLANLLIFLTVLSANLAVLNFLPIPLLDGGLAVLLLYEAVRGKPASERVQVALTYVGLAFIIALMLWVCGLDFGLIPRR